MGGRTGARRGGGRAVAERPDASRVCRPRRARRERHDVAGGNARRRGGHDRLELRTAVRGDGDDEVGPVGVDRVADVALAVVAHWSEEPRGLRPARLERGRTRARAGGGRLVGEPVADLVSGDSHGTRQRRPLYQHADHARGCQPKQLDEPGRGHASGAIERRLTVAVTHDDLLLRLVLRGSERGPTHRHGGPAVDRGLQTATGRPRRRRRRTERERRG